MLTMTGFMAGGRLSLLLEFGDNDATPAKVKATTQRITLKSVLCKREAILMMAKCISNTTIIRALVFTPIDVE